MALHSVYVKDGYTVGLTLGISLGTIQGIRDSNVLGSNDDLEDGIALFVNEVSL